MKRYTPGIEGISGYACAREDSNGDYVAYADVQAMHQVLLDLLACYDDSFHEGDFCCTLSDRNIIERARELTK